MKVFIESELYAGHSILPTTKIDLSLLQGVDESLEEFVNRVSHEIRDASRENIKEEE